VAPPGGASFFRLSFCLISLSRFIATQTLVSNHVISVFTQNSCKLLSSTQLSSLPLLASERKNESRNETDVMKLITKRTKLSKCFSEKNSPASLKRALFLVFQNRTDIAVPFVAICLSFHRRRQRGNIIKSLLFVFIVKRFLSPLVIIKAFLVYDEISIVFSIFLFQDTTKQQAKAKTKTIIKNHCYQDN
jgi:hypothetical protein